MYTPKGDSSPIEQLHLAKSHLTVGFLINNCYHALTRGVARILEKGVLIEVV